MKKFFLALMAVAAIAIAGCNKSINDPVVIDDLGAPDNIIPPTDTDGANQNRWGLAPERIPLPVTYTENDEE
ncbi:MAG: hypothetical protein MJZ92_00180 [Paludibacteraceae bacterium]|nr:hypothetical protein [Paludibacteraceae bacterium]